MLIITMINLLTASVFLLFICTVSYTQDDDPLSVYRWKHRVILLFSSPENELRQMQQAILDADKAGIKDRDLVVLNISLDSPGPWQKSIDRNHISAPFTFLLIGKDGGVKMRQTKPVSRDSLYSLIDSMPMRQAEMRRRDQ